MSDLYRIKPLEWRETHYGWSAQTLLGYYYVERHEDESRWNCEIAQYSNHRIQETFATAAKAKAFGDEHYREKITLALDPA